MLVAQVRWVVLRDLRVTSLKLTGAILQNDAVKVSVVYARM
jgi:hypothetical protein